MHGDDIHIRRAWEDMHTGGIYTRRRHTEGKYIHGEDIYTEERYTRGGHIHGESRRTGGGGGINQRKYIQ